MIRRIEIIEEFTDFKTWCSWIYSEDQARNTELSVIEEKKRLEEQYPGKKFFVRRFNQ